MGMTSAAPTFRHHSRLAPLLETWDSVTAFLEKGAGEILDLAIRVWVGQIFFVSGMLKIFFMSGMMKMVDMDVTVHLNAGSHPLPGLEANAAAALGVGVELLCPILLLFGLATRFAAVPLIVTVALLLFRHQDSIDHFYWMALLGFLILRGPGPISLDNFIDPHAHSTALPFGSFVRRFVAFGRRFLLPVLELVVRIGLAGLLWRYAFREDPAAFQAAGLILCALLAVGLAARVVAIALVLSSMTFLFDAPALGDPVMRLFLFAGFALYGAGALSLDHLLFLRALRLCPSLSNDTRWLDGAKRVAIVGAGFGGVAAALELRHAWARVTLIDRHNYHLFQPLLYQVATATLSPADIAAPIRALLRGQQNCRVLMEQATGVDAGRREVVLSSARVPFDYLVLATGARHSYFGKDSWETYAPGLKRIEDATAIRSRILAAFERAESCDDELERRRLLTFVMVGAGPTGVELAGAIAELARQGLREEFRSIDPATARIVLVQSGPVVLPSLPKPLSITAQRLLTELGVEVLTNSRVEAIDADGVQIGGMRIEARTVLWTAGVMASEAGLWIGAERDGAGRIFVGPDLAVPNASNIFALGDTASCKDVDGKPLPGLAAVAKQQGRYVAKLIRARIEGRREPGPFRYHDYGSMATIGRKAAVADLPFVKLTGALAWWFWGLVHVMFLVDTRSRLAVTFDWFWSYLTYNRSVRLITGGGGRAD
jgi:NADH dehydrogenase/putative oxidoreductase